MSLLEREKKHKFTHALLGQLSTLFFFCMYLAYYLTLHVGTSLLNGNHKFLDPPACTWISSKYSRSSIVASLMLNVSHDLTTPTLICRHRNAPCIVCGGLVGSA